MVLMENPVYLDYNATTRIDLEVAIEMMPYIETFFDNPSSSYYDYGKHGKNFHRKKHYR